MRTCRAAEALIVRDADGDALGSAERAALASHLAACAACRSLREANVEVRRVLASRPPGQVPAGFATRVAARCAGVESGSEGAQWLPTFDWRRWAEWTLPVAAGLMLWVGLIGTSRVGTGSGSSGMGSWTTSGGAAVAEAGSDREGADVIETWSLATDGAAGSAAVAAVLSKDVSDEELLAAMVGAARLQAPAATGTTQPTTRGTSDGR